MVPPMSDIRIFTEDLEIAKAILHRDETITKRYLYQQCYPLFKRYFDGYYTDCETCVEFISEIYVLIMTPSRKTGRCRLMGYRGESTLTQWLKVVCKYYCYSQFELKNKKLVTELFTEPNPENSKPADRICPKEPSIEEDLRRLQRNDVEVVLALMPNKRYSQLIRLRHVEQKSDRETAEALGMTMDNYYNKHKLAKEMFVKTLRKEERDA